MPRFPSAEVDLTGYAKIASGSYVGDSTVNRAIAHTLSDGDLCTIVDNVNNRIFILSKAGDFMVEVQSGTTYVFPVTPMDNTNFYVGNSSDYGSTANASGMTYHWRITGA